jgi:fructose PTS system EIIBC or EIIC component
MGNRSSVNEIKKHIMTGVSYMIPVVVAGGLLMAIAKIFGGALVGNAEFANTIPGMINTAGAAAMSFVVPVLTAFIAYSIADRPGIAPGLVVGFLAVQVKAGFLGGMLGGFFIGYLVIYIKKYIKLPKSFQGLMPIIVIPFLASIIGGLLMLTIIGKPIAAFQAVVLDWMKSLQNGSRFTLGAIIGAMMGFDMGGPVNKTASLFANGLLAEGIQGPTAAKIVGGMTPALGVALSVFIAKKKYTKAEHETAKAAFPLGLCFITEGVLPFAATDPLRVIPACSIGSAVASGLVMMWNVTSSVPHGGIFVVPIMQNPLMFILALIIGSCVTAGILTLIKPALPANQEYEENVSDDFDINIDIGN